MKRSLHSLVILALSAFLPAPALACEAFGFDRGTVRDLRLADLPDGIAAGVLDCGGTRYPVRFWTLPIDPTQDHLGVRDNRLFDTVHTGPLTRLVTATVEDRVRVVVLERSETAALSLAPVPPRRTGFRRFVTFCDDIQGRDPLDCSVGAVRIKARATAKHVDDDGYPDVTVHEISYYDGAARLHVISFAAPYSPRAAGDLSRWIGAINAVSDVLKPERTASVAP